MKVKIKLVTKNTKNKDKYLRGEQPLAGVVTHSNISQHSHNVNCGAALRHMRPSQALKETFEDYFDSGMSPADALHHHYAKVFAMENGKELVADGHFMPLDNSVYYWHKIWREVTHGDPLAPLETLEKKVLKYESEGIVYRVLEYRGP